jgi:hypothetical protein
MINKLKPYDSKFLAKANFFSMKQDINVEEYVNMNMQSNNFTGNFKNLKKAFFFFFNFSLILFKMARIFEFIIKIV